MGRETLTDKELMDELASRYDRLIVIRPNRKENDKIKVFAKSPCDEGFAYDLLEVTGMLQDAHLGLIRDSVFQEKDYE